MDLGIQGKTAFVAAGSDGLGKGVALRLAACGSLTSCNGVAEEVLLQP